MDQKNVRPSIEVMIHAVLNYKFVFHLHMVDVIGQLFNNPQKLVFDLSLNNIHAKIIPYKKPGDELASEIHDAIKTDSKIQLLLLKNHGVVIFSDNISEIKHQINYLKKVCNNKEIVNEYISQKKIIKQKEVNSFKYLDNPILNKIVFDERIFSKLESIWAICPDHIVFLGPRAFTFKDKESFQNINYEGIKTPLIFIKNLGIFVNTKIFTNIHLIQLQCFFDIVSRIINLKDIHVISNDEIKKLLNWDAEIYRQELNR